MEEVNFDKIDDTNNKQNELEEESPKEPSMKEKVDVIYDALKDAKKKKIKIPRKAKVRRGKLKKGFIGVIYIDENGNIKGEKVKVEGGCFRDTKAIRYHAIDGSEVLFWEGKFPVVIQPTWKKNPLNVRKILTRRVKKDGEEEFIYNETHGQKYIMARMLADVIKIKKKGGLSIAILIALIVGGYILYTIFAG